MRYETLIVEANGPVARVWLNRPEQHNPLNGAALEELIDAFGELQRQADTSVIILAGRGASFSAGADRKDPPGRLSGDAPASVRARRYAAQLGRRAVQAIERAEAITIARLHGHVIGGAVLLALACDLRVAAEGTSFWIPEVDLGVPLAWGGVPRLARQVGMARAKELILLCDRFDAHAAERYGLINRVVPDDSLDATVDEWANRLAAKPPWAVHMTKTQFRACATASSLGDATELDGDLLGAAFAADPTLFVSGSKNKRKG